LTAAVRIKMGTTRKNRNSRIEINGVDRLLDEKNPLTTNRKHAKAEEKKVESAIQEFAFYLVKIMTPNIR